MKKCNLIFLILVITALCLAVAGCATAPLSRTTERGEVIKVEKPLSVATDSRFEDIPIPAGFNCIRDQSFIFQDASTRVGLMRYVGRSNANQVLAFFKSQMALYNWDLQNIVEHGFATMNFVKSSESCVITVEPLSTKTIISVVISPKKGTMSTGLGMRTDKY